MAAIKRTGSAEWKGSVKEGKGTVSTQSGVLKASPYGFKTRFEGEAGTNPEELIGAAHAGCFSMALSAKLGEAKLTPDRIATTATVSLEKGEAGFSITAVHLDVTAKIPTATEAQFQTIAQDAKANCPVSKLLNTVITMTAKLE